jgi:hypothetical protein
MREMIDFGSKFNQFPEHAVYVETIETGRN